MADTYKVDHKFLRKSASLKIQAETNKVYNQTDHLKALKLHGQCSLDATTTEFSLHRK